MNGRGEREADSVVFSVLLFLCSFSLCSLSLFPPSHTHYSNRLLAIIQHSFYTCYCHPFTFALQIASLEHTKHKQFPFATLTSSQPLTISYHTIE
ncbi:MAG: hypothetical protein BYD32DRAFT_420958 [Podila humilis]|nr:MAG: hypothetical protein BYD32DRAFT_420958 [Podila humilis]